MKTYYQEHYWFIFFSDDEKKKYLECIKSDKDSVDKIPDEEFARIRNDKSIQEELRKLVLGFKCISYTQKLFLNSKKIQNILHNQPISLFEVLYEVSSIRVDELLNKSRYVKSCHGVVKINNYLYTFNNNGYTEDINYNWSTKLVNYFIGFGLLVSEIEELIMKDINVINTINKARGFSFINGDNIYLYSHNSFLSDSLYKNFPKETIDLSRQSINWVIGLEDNRFSFSYLNEYPNVWIFMLSELIKSCSNLNNYIFSLLKCMPTWNCQLLQYWFDQNKDIFTNINDTKWSEFVNESVILIDSLSPFQAYACLNYDIEINSKQFNVFFGDIGSPLTVHHYELLQLGFDKEDLLSLDGNKLLTVNQVLCIKAGLAPSVCKDDNRTQDEEVVREIQKGEFKILNKKYTNLRDIKDDQV